VFHLMLGIALVFPIIRLVGWGPEEKDSTISFSLLSAMIWGMVLGFIAGMLNIGGGIFLSPLLILLAWAKAKEAAPVSSLFIMCNSIAGLMGSAILYYEFTGMSFVWLLAAVGGGLAGAFWGSNRFNNSQVRYTLSAVMGIASIKLIFFM